MAARAAASGRDVGVYTTCHVVCRPTQDEAEAYYEHYAVAEQDTVSVDKYMKAKQTFSGSPLEIKRFKAIGINRLPSSTTLQTTLRAMMARFLKTAVPSS